MTSLCLTKLDTLSNIHPLRVCTAYRLGRRRLTEFPYSRSEVYDVEPVYESFPGFSGDVSNVRRFSGLPQGACLPMPGL